MRLLDTTTMELTLFPKRKIPRYAILSHVWETEEVTFQDIANLKKAKRMRGYAKIVGACNTAKKNGIDYIWIDTCCINKESSTELSEAINSMYMWYGRAAVCYAYLSDVSSKDDHTDRHSTFAKSHWFTRGWTLQELIAPRKVIFLAMDWVDIGTKATLQEPISLVTGISPEVIVGRTNLDDIPIAVRMSWAADRNTTQEEDAAYSLMGLFDVNMPLLYGEGRKAFIRLQLEIIKKSTDHSIFVWDEDTLSSIEGGGFRGLLARSPAKFRGFGNVEKILVSAPGNDQSAHVSISETIPYSTTNRGLSISLPIVKVANEGDTCKFLAFLNCRFVGNPKPIVITLQQSPALQPDAYFRVETTVWRDVPTDVMELAEMTGLYVAIDSPPRDRSRVVSVRIVVDLPVHYDPTIVSFGCRDGPRARDADRRLIFEKRDEAEEAILVFRDYDEFGEFAVISSREGPLWIHILSVTDPADEDEWDAMCAYLSSPTRGNIQWAESNQFLDRVSKNLQNGWLATVNTFDYDAITGGIHIDLKKTSSIHKRLPALPSTIEKGMIRKILPGVLMKIFRQLFDKK